MADKRAIHEFATGQGNQYSLFLMDSVDTQASSGYTTEKISAAELGEVLGDDIQFPLLLDTNVTTPFGAINELAAKILGITGDYDPTRTSSNPYNTGDLCFYQNVLKKCNDDDVYGTWDNTKWDDTTIADELANGGGGGGYPVLYGTTDPTSAQGSDGQLYAKYEMVNNVTSVIAMWLKIQSDWCSIVMSSGGDVGVECTQAQYDAWEQAGTLHEDTNYYITDGQSGGGVVIDDTTASVNTVYSSAKVEDLLSDKADVSTTYTKTEVDTALGVVGHNIAEEYDPTHTYSLGDLVIHENKFYKSNTNNVTGAWDLTKWDEVTVASELTNIVVKRTLTETTSSNGNIVNYINVANGIIVSAICTSQEAIVIPFQNSQGTLYSFHVMSPISAHGVVANTSVTIDFYMIPNRRII